MGFNFSKYAGKSGQRCNWMYEAHYLSDNQYGLVFVKDQASCSPETIRKKGSKFAVSDPRVNTVGDHDWAVVSKNQFAEYKDKGTYCQKPGMSGHRERQKDAIIGIGCVSGVLTKGSSGAWRPVNLGLPEGVPNLPGISTATGQKTDNPRYSAFQKRWDRNKEVAQAMREYEKAHPSKPKKTVQRARVNTASIDDVTTQNQMEI